MTRIGIIGTGFIAQGLASLLDTRRDMRPSRLLTRSDPATRTFAHGGRLTRSIDELIAHSDIVVECSGDVLHATAAIDAVLAASLPVITMDSEFHVTAGSHFVGRGLLTEAEGDQPGTLAALREHVMEMGFRPLAYGNVKGFLEPDPTPHEMDRWARRHGISLGAVTAFTDGTKVQIEQVLVANGLDAEIDEPGRLGLRADSVAAASAELADGARRRGRPLSDFVIAREAPPGVFIVAEHDESQREALRYLKQGPGPYTLQRAFHLVHLEIPRTIRRVLAGGSVLLDNSRAPRYGVAAVAKRALVPGERIERGIGSFQVRGSAVRLLEAPGHVPIGLLSDAIVQRHVERGQRLDLADVELPDSLALRAWREIERRALATSPAPAG